MQGFTVFLRVPSGFTNFSVRLKRKIVDTKLTAVTTGVFYGIAKSNEVLDDRRSFLQEHGLGVTFTKLIGCKSDERLSFPLRS